MRVSAYIKVSCVIVLVTDGRHFNFASFLLLIKALTLQPTSNILLRDFCHTEHCSFRVLLILIPDQTMYESSLVFFCKMYHSWSLGHGFEPQLGEIGCVVFLFKSFLNQKYYIHPQTLTLTYYRFSETHHVTRCRGHWCPSGSDECASDMKCTVHGLNLGSVVLLSKL